MSIEKLPSGLFRGVVRHQGKKRATAAAGTRAEAAVLEAQLKIEMSKSPIITRDHTVGELLTGYLADAKAKLSPTTMAQHHRSVAALPQAFLDRSVSTVTGEMLDTLYAGLVNGGHSEHRTQKVHKLLSVAFKRATRYRWATVNPCRDVDNKPNPASPEIHPPTLEQVHTLIAGAEGVNADLAVFLRLAASTGVRRGEGVALKWSDVTTEKLTIRRSLVQVGSAITERATKTGAKGHRVIALDNGTSLALQVLKERQAKTAAEHGLPDPVWVFSHDAGVTPWRPHYTTLAFKRLADEYGMPSVRLHDLRHFMATQMLGQGVDATTVSKRLGHATTTTTLRTYAHFMPERDKDAADALGTLLI